MEKNNSGTILLVDDSELDVVLLTEILSGDYTIHVAKNGQEGIIKAVELMPDIILLDIVMPVMDGYETIAKLKNIERTRAIPVIFISGLDKSKDERKGLSLGCADYITKPFHEDIVKLRVDIQFRILKYIRTIEVLSLEDQLTEIPNRRGFEERFLLEWGRAIRDNSPISVLIIDIDHFKKVNDLYGHLQGDLVLKSSAETIVKILKRVSDFAARWGGDEFIALLPNTNPDGADLVSEIIRKTFEDKTFPLHYGLFAKITVSIGVYTRIPSKDCSKDDFIHLADDALYAAKLAGRNKAYKANEGATPTPVMDIV